MIKINRVFKLLLIFSAGIVLNSLFLAISNICQQRQPLLHLRFLRYNQPRTALLHSNLSFCFLFKIGTMSEPDKIGWIKQLKSSYFATKDEIRLAWLNSTHTRERLSSHFWTGYSAIPRADLLATALGTLSAAWLLRRCLHRYKNTNDLPLQFFEKQKKLTGLAVTVNDSDNLRFYHQPNWLLSLLKPNLARQDLKYHTINVRLAGIDAPEMAHFGTKPQPYAVEAKEWLTSFVQGRRVRIQLLRIDRYGRAVAMVWVQRRRFPYWLWPVWWNVSLEMVSAGFATIYRDAGAEYGNIKEKLVQAEAKAKKQKIGMWKQSASEYQSPGDFKRLNRLNAAITTLKNNGLIDDPALSAITQNQHRKIDFIASHQQQKQLRAQNGR